MIIVEREISEYTHHKIIVGIFENTEKANKAKKLYIEYCKDNDKWSEQAYRTVSLNDDVIISDVSEILEGDKETIIDDLYVISYFMEGFGQETRITEKIFIDSNDAKKYVKLKESEEPEYEPCWYETNVIRVNKIYFKELE
ncbi:hypothetical protein [Tenacibaculum ovolyticum]|uniref:hypothetical protein n=1 Tax=Tenacibaculum ovolyticum TaxID=104270 RepID=UPI0004296EF8|nr:hypothetical protein [Tenacibaculum ovolyticum]